MLTESYFLEAEQELADEFSENGYVIKRVENLEGLQLLQKFVVDEVCKFLKSISQRIIHIFLKTFIIMCNQKA